MKKLCLFFMVILTIMCMVFCANAATTNGWVKEDMHLCYYKEGVKVTGTQTINNYVYYFTDEGYLKHNGQVQNARYYGSVYIDENDEMITGWNTIKGNIYYFFPEDGKAALYNYNNYSTEIDGERYVFDSNGILQINSWYNSVYGDEEGKALSGYQAIGDHKYLFSETGCAQTGFYEIEGQLHYFMDSWGENTYEALGWALVSSYLYYFDPQTGVMQVSPREIDGTSYTFNNDGSLIHDGDVIVKFIDGKWYGYDKNNVRLSGWQVINEETYYFNQEAYTDACEINNEYYYFDEQGKMQKNLLKKTRFYQWDNDQIDHLFYYGEDGKRVKGWQTIAGNTYYFNSSAYIGEYSINDATYFFDENGILQKDYMRKTDGGHLYYYGADGKRVTGWQTIKSYKYYFDEYDGAYTGRRQIGDDIYYFNDDGIMQINTFATISGWQYYYGPEGKEVTGWQIIENETYYFNPYAYIGVYNIDGSYYCFDDNCRLQKDVLKKIVEGHGDETEYLYYFGEDGKRVTGWATINGDTYYFESCARKGICWIEDDYYYFDEEGRLKKNIWEKTINEYGDSIDRMYYFGADGKRVTGWKEIDGFKYYFDPCAYTDACEINNEYYYFDEQGKMQKNLLIKTRYYQYSNDMYLYYYGADGKRVRGWQTINGSKYYFDEYSGACIGERQIDDCEYYFDEKGIMQSDFWNKKEENGYKCNYYYGSDGKRISGWKTLNGETYYFRPEACTDVCYIDDAYYYFDEQGRMQKNLLKKTKVYEGDNTEGLFYYGKDGKRVTGWVELNGDKYYFDNNGAKTGKTKLDPWDIWTGNDYVFSEDGKLIDTIIYATDISLENQSVTVVEGETIQVVPIIYPANATSKKVNWTSYDDSIAQVDTEGKITGVSPGNATVLVSLESNSHWIQCFVQVLPNNSIEGFVYRCYRTILERDPDDVGLNTWVNELYSGRKAAAEIIEQFVDSAEFQNKKLDNGQVVEILYKTMMGRGSDPTGKVDWVEKMNAGQHVTAVINGFCGSDEFLNICNNYGINPGMVEVQENPSMEDDLIRAYVERCYLIILGRAPDAGGMDTWFNELKSGRKAAAEIIEQFVASAEFQNQEHNNEESVEILYNAMLGRGSDPAGKADWVEKLNAGQHFTAVINGFCGSAEFKAICDTYGIQPGTVSVQEPTVPSANDEKIRAFVTRCYKIILGRDADEGGMNTWFNELKSRRKAAAEIIEQFVSSSEFQNQKHSNPDSVEILYKAMLGRGSDPAGKADWVAKLNNGQPLTAIINGFCGSTEFKAICDAYGITPGSVQVQQLSSQPVVEEEPVAKQTVTKTENNVTKVEIVNPSDTENAQLGTAVQAIYINEEKAKEYIGRCYRCILGREASQSERDSWISQIMDGTKTADQIARGFLFSGEFKDKNVSNDELVKILYRVYMNREADAEGLTTWTQKLDEGTSLQALLDTFAKTNEFIAVTRDMAQ